MRLGADHVRVRVQQRLECAMQLRIADRETREPGRALGRVHLDELVEGDLHFFPALGVHRSGSPLSSSASHARANRSSRLAVASDTPVAAALSSSVRPPK